MLLRGLRSLAVEANRVNAVVARILWLIRLVRIDDCHIGSATALRVLDHSAGRLARRAVLAARSVGHGIVKLEITVEFGRDLEFTDRGLLYALALITADLGAGVPVFRSLACDAL